MRRPTFVTFSFPDRAYARIVPRLNEVNRLASAMLNTPAALILFRTETSVFRFGSHAVLVSVIAELSKILA